MTIRQAYRALLVELDKVKAPAILLDDFNYLFNKMTIVWLSSLFDKRFSATQSDVDAISSVVSQAKLKATNNEVELPDDYFRLLNCFVVYGESDEDKCGNKAGINYPARHLNPARSEEVMKNAYLCPTKKRPYYQFKYLSVDDKLNTTTAPDIDFNGEYNVGGYMDNTGSNFLRTIKISSVGDPFNYREISNIERETAIRYGRPTRSKLQLYTGDKSSASHIVIDYIKAPQNINLTPEQMDLVEDTSQILEWDDFACHTILALVLDSVAKTTKIVSQ